MTTIKTKPRVLIVDDVPGNIKALSVLLREDCHIVMATSGQIALKAVASQDIDLILLDIEMPEMDGYEVCRRLHSNPESEDIPVIFVTAQSEVQDEAHGLELGAVDYITKPVTPSILKARVKTQLTLKEPFTLSATY
jgi:CheY-like chemotaxis protein